MGQRLPEEQFEHDLVVEAAAEQFGRSKKYQIHANPGSEKNAAVSHQYPDIIVTERGANKVKFIIEVETANSLDGSEVNQWRTFARLGPPLYLLAPHLAMPLVQRLCTAAGVKCHHGYYLQDERGRIKVVLMKEGTTGHGPAESGHGHSAPSK
jgi:hypothetical protein